MLGKLDQSRDSRSPDRTSESAPRNYRGSMTRGSVYRGSQPSSNAVTFPESNDFAALGSLGVISPECGHRIPTVGLAGALSFKGSVVNKGRLHLEN